MSLVEISELTRHFGGLAAVSSLDMDIGAGVIHGLIGPNGAGKSTALNLIGGDLPPSRGTIRFEGKDVSRLPSHRRAELGIARVYQENLLLDSFSALDNVIVGLHLKTRMNVREIILGGRRARDHDRRLAVRAEEILERSGLRGIKNQPASSLPHGQQRILSLAIALAVEPKLLLLDEPLSGMNAEEVDRMMEIIRDLNKHGMTCLVVEHNLKAIMGLCDFITVLNFGMKLAEGSPQQISNHPAVIEAYIGVDDEEE
jgi:branched-chain amino acid transport system ATP-binding protein